MYVSRWDSELPEFLRFYTAGFVYTRIDNQVCSTLMLPFCVFEIKDKLSYHGTCSCNMSTPFVFSFEVW